MFETDPTISSPDGDWTELALEIRLVDGHGRRIPAAHGFSAMELMRAAGVPVRAECGGSGVCSTCHCRVPDAWTAKLPAPADDELEKLDEIPAADDRSRLSCQIRMTDDLDGLVLELQPDSLLKTDSLLQPVNEMHDQAKAAG